MEGDKGSQVGPAGGLGPARSEKGEDDSGEQADRTRGLECCHPRQQSETGRWRENRFPRASPDPGEAGARTTADTVGSSTIPSSLANLRAAGGRRRRASAPLPVE